MATGRQRETFLAGCSPDGFKQLFGAFPRSQATKEEPSHGEAEDPSRGENDDDGIIQLLEQVFASGGPQTERQEAEEPPHGETETDGPPQLRQKRPADGGSQTEKQETEEPPNKRIKLPGTTPEEDPAADTPTGKRKRPATSRTKNQTTPKRHRTAESTATSTCSETPKVPVTEQTSATGATAIAATPVTEETSAAGAAVTEETSAAGAVPVTEETLPALVLADSVSTLRLPPVGDQVPRCGKCLQEVDPLRCRYVSKNGEKFKCQARNSKHSGLCRMLGAWPIDAFKRLPPEEQTTFWQQAGNTREHLKQQVFDIMKKEYVEQRKIEESGTYLPLSVYGSQGYDTDRIAKFCKDTRIHPELGLTYKVNLLTESTATMERKVRENMLQMIADARGAKKKRAATDGNGDILDTEKQGGADSASPSSSDSSSDDKKKKKKKNMSNSE